MFGPRLSHRTRTIAGDDGKNTCGHNKIAALKHNHELYPVEYPLNISELINQTIECDFFSLLIGTQI